MTDQQMADEEYLQHMVNGRVPPPNEYAKHAVSKIQEHTKLLASVRQRAAATRSQLRQLEDNEVQCLSVIEAYSTDLRMWGLKSAEVAPSPDAPAVKNGADEAPIRAAS